ncbi:sugar phosphate isomerase/epimerase family protein [Gluconacetobacter sacchari]|uniref:sugar phosphate isomerase/epimerase family protein n=1 Tax=Gluconacetobacter sacchari TaxID=92759 RepID=UPI0039B40192
MTIQIGTAPDAWGVWYAEDPRQTPWERYLDEVAQAGYGWTELGPWGYLPTDRSRLAEALAARHLGLCGAAVVHPLAEANALETLRARLRPLCETLVATGTPWLLLMDDSDVYPTRQARIASPETWRHMMGVITEAGRVVAQDHGLRLLFHPHVGTAVETEEEILRLLADTPEDLVALCYDFGHHAYTGADALAFMRAHADRIPYYHFKNLDGSIHARAMEAATPFMEVFQNGVMCELDRGVIDFAEVVAFLKARNFEGFAVVEQDMYPCPPEKPLPIARHNREALRRLGL